MPPPALGLSTGLPWIIVLETAAISPPPPPPGSPELDFSKASNSMYIILGPV